MSVAEIEISEASSAPARSRAETRRRLVAAATELFASEGLHGVTTARIASRAGVATGTFYLHFDDKQALFREIAFSALRRLQERQAAAAEGQADLRAELRARTEEMLRFAEENRALVRVLFGRGQEAGSAGEEILDRIVGGLELRLAERIAAGEVWSGLDPAVAARALAGMNARVVTWWIEDPTRSSRERVVETLLHMHPLFIHASAP